MRYNIAAYDDSYRSISKEYGDEWPGRIEAASNLVGLKWKNSGRYRITFDSISAEDENDSKEETVEEFDTPGELGLKLYSIMTEFGLDVSVAKTRK